MPAATRTMALARSKGCRRLAPPSHGPYAHRFSPPLRLRTQFVVLRGGHKIQSPAAALPLAFRRRKHRRRPASIDIFTHLESTLVNADTDRRTFHTVLPCFRETVAETGGWSRRPDAQAAQVDMPQCSWAPSIFF